MKICVVGLGYVGLPLALELSKHYDTIGFDVNENKINQLNQNKDPNNEISKETLSNTNIKFSSDPESIKECNFIIIAVPTPINENLKPDLKYLISASEIVGKNLNIGSIVVYESTVYPGCTEEECIPILEKKSNLKCIEDFKVGYSPERINPGDKEHTVDKITKIVSCIDEDALDTIAEVYGKVTNIHKAKNIKTAEAAKVIENIQRDLNIALVNELSIIFNKLNLDTKEVLEAAGTKWNFHKYSPGLVGGHCFDKKSNVFLIDKDHHKITSIGEYIDSLGCKKKLVKGFELFYPEDLNILSFNIKNNQTSFKPVTLASKRKVKHIIKIKCAYNYNLEVTDKHPVIIYDKGLRIKYAKDIKAGDKLILNKNLPCNKTKVKIDFLDYLEKKHYKKIRVKLKDKHFSDFRDMLNKNIQGKKGNYFNWDYLPLEKYLKIEKKLKLPRKDIYLCTGRGPGLKLMPCIIDIDKDFLRLIGYYLSEGCITKDQSLRTRFTFHRNEDEYIKDVKDILNNIGLDLSVYHDKKFQSSTIKVSSFLFGFLLKDILKCGTNCYNMQIPELFFDLRKELKEELLKGLFRGDGGVSWYNGTRRYKKNKKEYDHNFNSLEISYFTSSQVLFQQVILFLLNQNVLPKLAKRQGYLSIIGPADTKRVKDWFLGDKHNKLNSYLENIKKEVYYKKAKHHPDYITLLVEDIEKRETDYVYSMEVAENHTLVTSNGIIAHNCIGVDPYYLTHKAQELGHYPKVILAGREINEHMSKHVADLTINALARSKKPIQDAKVLLLGLTFKENVNDPRNSKAKDLIKHLRDYQIKVIAHDPLMDNNTSVKEFGIENKELDKTEKVDAVIMLTPHKEFNDLTLEKLKQKTNILIDVKSHYKKDQAKELGFTYRSL